MKALIVEDNEDSRVLLRDVLEGNGYLVRDAENGLKALELIRKGFTPDIVISDILMPDMDGYALCRALKSDPCHRHIPFIFYTATFTDPRDEQLALDMGADRFFVKPRDMAELVTEIDKVLEEAAAKGKRSESATATPERIEREYSDALSRKLSKKIKDLEREREKLRRSEAKYRRLVEALRDDYFFYTVEPDNTLSYVSPSVTTVLGYTPRELMDEQSSLLPFRCGHPADVPGGPVSFEIRVKHKNGQERLLKCSEEPVFDQEGRCIAVEGLAHDLTPRRCLEEKLRQAQKMEAIGTLAGGIAHDFNNILSAIIGYAELIRSRADNQEIRADADTILLSCRRATSLVRQILTFSRNSGCEKQAIRPHLIVKEALHMLRATIPATIMIREEIDSQCGPVLINPTGLHQIMLNLCTNAVHAMEGKKGELHVILRPEPPLPRPGPLHATSCREYVALEIHDTGCGMDEHLIERIFDPYYTTKKKGEGTGLGLAVVQGIVREAGGTIRVESKPDQGSVFTIQLPVAPSGKEEQEQPARSGPVRARGEHILVVDDEEILVHLNMTRLQILGYRVTGTTDPREALAMIRRRPLGFDLLVTDQTMPHLTGVELAARARAVNPDLAVILCSGHQEVVHDQGAKENTIDCRLHKPLRANEFLRTIREVLDRKKQGSASA